MRAECIESLITCGHEIEFKYNGKRYSITYFGDEKTTYISFCEFYKEPIDVKNSYELLKIKIDGKTLEEIFSKLPDSAFCIF